MLAILILCIINIEVWHNTVITPYLYCDLAMISKYFPTPHTYNCSQAAMTAIVPTNYRATYVCMYVVHSDYIRRMVEIGTNVLKY